MSASNPARRALLLALATFFAAATVVYSFIWMSVIRHPFGDIGFRYTYSSDNRSLPVLGVGLGGPAEKAGLRAGDRIVAINGQTLDTPTPSYRALDLGKVGDVLELTVNRPGTAAPLTVREVIPPLQLIFSSLGAKAGGGQSGQRPLSASKLLAGKLLGLYPLLFLVVGDRKSVV